MEEVQFSNGMNPQMEAALLQSIDDHLFSSSMEQFNPPNTSNGVDASSQVWGLDGPLDWNVTPEQLAMHPSFVPKTYDGDSARGSRPSYRILDNINTRGASNDLVLLANNRQMTVMGWGNYQHTNAGNDLNPNGQFQTISGSSDNLISMTQPLMAPHSVPLVTEVQVSLHARRVVENNSETPITPNMHVSGANSQLNNVMKPQFLQNMHTGCAQFGHPQSFNLPLSNAVSQQLFAVAPVSSGLDTAGRSVRGSQSSHQILGNIDTRGASNDLVPMANNRQMTGTQILSTAFHNPSLQSENAHVVENNRETPSAPNMPVSGVNSQLKNVMKTQFLQNMHMGRAPFGPPQRFNLPLNNVVPGQHFSVAPVSSGVDTAVMRRISVGASKHPNLENNHESPGDSARGSPLSHQILNTSGASNDLVPLANNRQMTEWQYRHVNTSNDLNPNCQWSNNNPIRMTQPLAAPHCAPPVTDVAENNSATPSTPNMPASGPNSQVHNVMKPRFPQNMKTGSGPSGHLQRLNAPVNNFVSQQSVAPTSRLDPTGISVGASQQQNLENSCESPGAANSFGSSADRAKQSGSEPSYHQNKDINVQLRFNDNQTSSAGSGMILFTVPCFVVEIPEDMPFNLWKGAIIEVIEVALENVLDNFRNTKLPISDKVTIGKKRAMQTVLHEFKERDILTNKKGKGPTKNDFSCDTNMNIVEEPHNSKSKKVLGASENDISYDNEMNIVGEPRDLKGKMVQGAAENDISNDTKMNIVEVPHDSKGKKVQGATETDSSYDTNMNTVDEHHDSKGILCPDIRNSGNALSEIAIVRNQNAGGVIRKSTSINALTPKMEEQNVDSMHQMSDPSPPERRLFSPEELELLVNAAEEHGTGGWRKIKHVAFKNSVKTGNDLKDKWNSLVKKAKTDPDKRRGEPVSQELLDRVLKIEARDARQRGKTPKSTGLPPNNP